MNSTEKCVVSNQVDISSDLSVNTVGGEVPSKESLATTDISTEFPPQFKTSLVDIDVVAGSSAKFVVQVSNTSQSLKVYIQTPMRFIEYL